MYISLVQRGTFTDATVDTINGIDDLIDFQYMGSSEYEWGALPKSLRRIVSLYKDKKLHFTIVTILDKEFYLACNKAFTVEEQQEIVTAMTSSAKQDYKHWFKEMPYMKKFFEGKTIQQPKRGCKKKIETVSNYWYCDFWWDISNDWFLFPTSTIYLEKMDYLERVEKALQMLITRKFYDGAIPSKGTLLSKLERFIKKD